MSEFLKCLATGLTIFGCIGVILTGFHLASTAWPDKVPYVMSGVFAFGMALWVGAFCRSDL